MRRSDADKEQDLVRAAVPYLLASGIPCYRSNTGATRIGDRFIRFGIPGSPDIIGIMPGTGQFLGIECKMPGRYLSQSQKAFQSVIERNGGIYIVARTMDDIDAVVSRMQKIRIEQSRCSSHQTIP